MNIHIIDSLNVLNNNKHGLKDEDVCLILNDKNELEKISFNGFLKHYTAFLDLEKLRKEFIAFVSAWPSKPIYKSKSFDQLFKRKDGYSIWWTGPGIDRHPEKGVFPIIKKMWVCNEAIKQIKPKKIVVYSDNLSFKPMIESIATRYSIECECVGKSTVSNGLYKHGKRWLLLSTLWPFISLSFMSLRAIFIKIFTFNVGEKIGKDGSKFIFSTAYPRHVDENGVWYWKHFILDIKKKYNDTKALYFMSYRKQLIKKQLFSQIFDVGNLRQALNKVRTGLPFEQSYICFFSAIQSSLIQFKYLITYYFLEKRSEYRSSFIFNNIDLAALYVPLLRREISRYAVWERAVSSIECSLKKAGKAFVFFVNEEFYARGQMEIAAAKRLSLKTIGVQHGTFFPLHMMYTPPKKQIEASPIVERMMVFSEYAQDVLTGIGCYSKDRTWVIGNPWFKSFKDGNSHNNLYPEFENKRVVVLATQLYSWFKNIATALYEYAKMNKDVFVCIKAHPRDKTLSVYKQCATEYGIDNVGFYQEDFYSILNKADVFISASSTSLLEAILLKKQAICANFSDEPDYYPYVLHKGAYSAKNKEELFLCLDKCKNDFGFELLDQDSFIEKHLATYRSDNFLFRLEQFGLK